MSDVFLIAQAAEHERPQAPPSVSISGEWLTLSEVSGLSGLAIHELKREIQAGSLPAKWCGLYLIHRGELAVYLHR